MTPAAKAEADRLAAYFEAAARDCGLTLAEWPDVIEDAAGRFFASRLAAGAEEVTLMIDGEIASDLISGEGLSA